MSEAVKKYFLLAILLSKSRELEEDGMGIDEVLRCEISDAQDFLWYAFKKDEIDLLQREYFKTMASVLDELPRNLQELIRLGDFAKAFEAIVPEWKGGANGSVTGGV